MSDPVRHTRRYLEARVKELEGALRQISAHRGHVGCEPMATPGECLEHAEHLADAALAEPIKEKQRQAVSESLYPGIPPVDPEADARIEALMAVQRAEGEGLRQVPLTPHGNLLRQDEVRMVHDAAFAEGAKWMRSEAAKVAKTQSRRLNEIVHSQNPVAVGAASVALEKIAAAIEALPDAPEGDATDLSANAVNPKEVVT